MRKLRLSVEELRIESFATDANSSRRGTVQGQSYWEPSHITVCPYICSGDPYSEDTCAASCGYAGYCPQTPDTNCEM